MQEDKRKDPRLDFGIAVIHDRKLKMAKDISLNGTFIRSDEQSPLLPIGSDISFSFDFPNKKRNIEVKGVVVHHGNKDDGMGIWFKKIDERSKEFISKLILDNL